MTNSEPEITAFRDRIIAVGTATLMGLNTLEVAGRYLHPPNLPKLAERLRPLAKGLAEPIALLRGMNPPEGAESIRDALLRGAEHAEAALHGFAEGGAAGQGGVPRIIEAMRENALALEALYPLRFALPPMGHLFAEEPWHDRLDELDPEPPEELRVGLHAGAEGGNRGVRGGFVFYIPESARDGEPLPLVVALHGGFGHGADFLWTWLREARSRRFLLLAPTSRSTTWSLQAPATDEKALRSMVEFLTERFPVDPERILLTGLSDGATFSLLAGLAEDAPYTALAPLSGVLHPLNFSTGNMERAQGRPIYLVHGALDWMFPVSLARMARDELEKAGAELVYREITDLSHTYAREENARILEWFDPSLALQAP
ncbi:MAG: phospholipase [bacterium]|nr:phospholipase [bacterium]MCP5065405.1 phospholipase [bacterium]